MAVLQLLAGKANVSACLQPHAPATYPVVELLNKHAGLARGGELTGPCMSYRNALQLFPITINLIRIMDRKCPSVANAVWHQLTEIL